LKRAEPPTTPAPQPFAQAATERVWIMPQLPDGQWRVVRDSTEVGVYTTRSFLMAVSYACLVWASLLRVAGSSSDVWKLVMGISVVTALWAIAAGPDSKDTP
jgi:hypothetical protein